MKNWIALAALTLAGSHVSAATILTFDIDGLGDEQAVPQEYGDNVSSADDGVFHYGTTNGQYTPHVTFGYASSGAFYINDYAGLTRVHYLDDSSPGPGGDSPRNDLTIYSFSAEASYTVTLESIDLTGYGGGFFIPSIVVADSIDSGGNPSSPGNVLFSTSFGNATGAATLPINVTSSGGGQLFLLIDAAGGTSNGFAAIDNIVFSETFVPEPGAVAGLAAAGLVVLRRRR